MAATLLTPCVLGGATADAGVPDVLVKAAPGVVALVGLYDLVVAHETLWQRRNMLPAYWHFSPALGKGVLVLDVNRMIGFYLFSEGSWWWLAWVAFALSSYVFSTWFMMNKGRSFSYYLVMLAGYIGLLLDESTSGVPPELSGAAGMLSGALIVCHALKKEDTTKWE
mmetsp:Transcript_13582/g.37972  ORF Transcript_13582/g.37972 Transcript_13582/m.37972 type:complete len:167 (-) Transcript_13582:183-683(-)